MNSNIRGFAPSRILIILLVGFIAGIFFAPNIVFDLNQELFLLFGMTLGLFFLYPIPIYRIVVLFLVTFVLGCMYFQIWQGYKTDQNISEIVGEDKTVSGVIIEEIEFDIKYQKIILGYLQSKKQKYRGKILIYLPKYPKYYFGEQLKITGEIQKPQRFETFDWRQYLAMQKIYATSYQPNIERAKSNLNWWQNLNLKTKGLLVQIKIWFLKNIYQAIAEPEAGLFAGILLGQKKALPEDLLNIFNRVGLTHIIALSGFNITIIVRAFMKISQNWSRKTAFFLAIWGIGMFVIMVGAQASVVRAAVMAGLILMAERLGRKADILVALLLAAVGMSLFNPLLIRYDVGFQLSFMATAGLIFFYEPIGKWRVTQFLPKFLREFFVATLAALSLSLPLIVYYFDRLSLIAPIINTLVLPVVPPVMFLGFLAGLGNALYIGIGQVLGFLTHIFLAYIIGLATWFDRIPIASIKIDNFGIGFLILYYLLLIFIYWRLTCYNKNILKNGVQVCLTNHTHQIKGKNR